MSVRAVRLLGVFDRDFRGLMRWPAHAYKLYLPCESLGGTPAADGVETEEARYFPLDRLPPLSEKTPADQLAGGARRRSRPGHGGGFRLARARGRAGPQAEHAGEDAPVPRDHRVAEP